MTEEMAVRLLQATREQLHGKPTREVKPFSIAKKAAINPYPANTTQPCDTYSTTVP
jgi:hypothetical protein